MPTTEQMLYTLEELAEATGIVPRNIRYYQTAGLLPSPASRGRHALYSDAHLQRLQLIEQLKAAYLPLGVIKEKMEQITDENAGSLLKGEALPEDRDAETETAAAYIARVLANRRTQSSTRPSKTSVAASQRRGKASSEAAEGLDAPGDAWRHLRLLPGVELCFKAPVSRKMQAQVEELIAYARSLGNA